MHFKFILKFHFPVLFIIILCMLFGFLLLSLQVPAKLHCTRCKMLKQALYFARWSVSLPLDAKIRSAWCDVWACGCAVRFFLCRDIRSCLIKFFIGQDWKVLLFSRRRVAGYVTEKKKKTGNFEHKKTTE